MKDELTKYFAEIGRKGGKSKSVRKTEAARANARRPRKKEVILEAMGLKESTEAKD
jgi:hypothetical protein